ncbi:helicase associated domain-containing protein [Kitasatospora aureofaciens]|uniref:helicase associated domain-containing protein n=1 Tax=Kitasatospora aureofaciens TaxID=1894 RepID=UPI0037C7347A
MQWERPYRAARAHARAGNRLDPAQGFPGTPDALGDWLYRQCTGYQRLHPRQQELLTDIGITAEQAALVRRRRSPRTLAFETGLAHARAYATEHGHLAAPGTAVHHGYPVGRWLATQRERAANHRLHHGQAHALNTIDPWWNPPWPLTWQRTWHQAHTHHTTNTAPPRHLTAWTTRQRTRWNALYPQQQQLLTTIGVEGL